MSTDIENRLRSGLADEAAVIGGAPPGLFADVVTGARRQRRNRMAAVGAAACAVVAAATVPLLASPGHPSAPDTGDAASPSASYQRYPYDPRGSLAGDTAYVRGLLALPWTRLDGHAQPVPDPDHRQVVFAGEVPGGVQALVVGWDGARVVDGATQPAGWVGMWLHGLPGTAPEDLEHTSEPARLDPAAPMSQSWTVDGAGSVVVVTRPGDVIEYSAGQDVQADGTVVRRDWRRVGDATGVAVVPTDGTTELTRSVRVLRDGHPLTGSAGGAGMTAGTDPGAFDPTAALAGAAGTPDAGLVRGEMGILLPELGLRQDQVETHVLWGGSLSSAAVPDAEAAVFTVRVPSGAVVLIGAMGSGRAEASDGAGLTTMSPCLEEVLPVGTDVAATGVAMRCDLRSTEDGTVRDSRLVVLPPAGAARLQLTDAGPDVPVAGPASITGVPAGTTRVTASDASGTDLGVVPLYGVDDVRLHD